MAGASYKIDFELLEKALLPKLEKKEFLLQVVATAAQTD